MASKKLVSEATIEQLLASLETEDLPNTEVRDESYDDDVLNFMQAFDIKPGSNPVSRRLMYRIYKKWSRTPLTEKTFGFQIGAFILTEANTHYLISHNHFSLNKVTKLLLEQRRSNVKRRVNIKHYRDFFAYYAIKPGAVFLEGYILFYLYEEWCDKFKRKRKYNFDSFHTSLKAFYEFHLIQGTLQYKIDSDIFKYLPDTKLAALRKGWRKYRGKKTK